MHDEFVDGDRALAPLLLLHGDGGAARDLMPIARFLAPGAPQLAIAGRERAVGRTSFFRHDPGGTPTTASLTQAAAGLLARVRELAAHYQLPLARMVVIGYSNGGSLAAWAMMKRPLPFRTALLFHPQALTPIAAPALAPSTLVWASYGTQDPIVAAHRFTALGQQIRTAGGQLTVYTHDQQHNLTMAELQRAKAWLLQSGRLKEESR
ncbi:alpha/beta hydrolase [Lacticaseibacillus jixianensis]|uniref:Alpha/beta hydrolase n=1 Tax=Lacticaseibacillus jixianensis TaxID=2486012 RepID=A0ABW4BDQ7_9LACO|nr:dienelactone hydrolase family protein [Lacticaseibacillus jixianensis]